MKTVGCLIFFLASTICVAGNNPGVNNNSEDQHFKQHFAGPRGQGFCSDVCDDIRRECGATCYPPKATARTIFTDSLRRGLHSYEVVRADLAKYECFNTCLRPDDAPIMIDQSSCVAASESTEEDEENGNEIKFESLTMKKRCELPAFTDSLVCKLETENPTISKQVFVSNRGKLSLCPGGKVFSGERGLYVSSAHPTNMRVTQNQDQPAEDNEDRNPAKRSVMDEESLQDIMNRSLVTTGNNKINKPRPNSPKETKEFCMTRRRIESRGSATHVRTQRQVSLYFYGPYSQWYEAGECIRKEPLEGANCGGHCAMTETSHKVWIMVEDNKANRKLFNDCFSQRGSKYLVCHDWVLIPTHCKLFYEE